MRAVTTRWTRFAALAASSLGLMCLFPAVAGAARIELRPGQTSGTSELVYTAGAGEVNDPGLQRHEDWYYLQDSEGPPTERVPPCEENPRQAGLGVSSRCPNPGNNVASVVVDLGDRDDFGRVDQNTLLYIPVTVLGGAGRDRLALHSPGGNLLDGGPGDDVIAAGAAGPDVPAGKDTVLGGDGDDEIDSTDDQSDIVRCGPGSDTVKADASDDVASDCETVELPPSENPWVRSDGKPIGVTIENAAIYTNSPDVSLTVLAPDSATHLRISNDGGFGSWFTAPRNDIEVYRFELPSTGPERLPKTVYVRFDGPGLDPNRTFTDDIILDQTAATVRTARVLHRSRRGVRVALRARDATSGVKTAQFARVRSQPWRRIGYRRRVTVRRTPRWVRVRDRAGNVSPWRSVGR